MHSLFSVAQSIKADLDEREASQNVRQESQALSGPGESSSSKSVQNPWSTGRVHVQGSPSILQKGKGKLVEQVDMQNVSSGHSVNDGDSSGSDVSPRGVHYK